MTYRDGVRGDGRPTVGTAGRVEVGLVHHDVAVVEDVLQN